MKQTFFALTAAALVLPLPALAQHSITPHDVVTLKRVAEVQISPDKREIAYSVTTPMPATEAKVESLWLVEVGQPGTQHLLAHSDGADSMPRWSPDGKRIAFLSTRKNPIHLHGSSEFAFALANIDSRPELVEATKDDAPKDKPQGAQLWLITLGGGEAVPLTNLPGEIREFKWSPDGSKIAFMRDDTDPKAAALKKEKKIDEQLVDANYKFSRLYIYDLVTRTARLVTLGERNICDFDWSPDASRVIARISPTPRLDDYWRVSKVQILDATTGEPVRTLAEHAASMAVRWSADGTHVSFSKMTARTITGLPMVYDLTTGKEAQIGANLPITWGSAQWSADGKHLLASGDQLTTAVLGEIDPVTGKATVRLQHVGGLRDYAVSADGKLLAAATGTTAHPAEVTTFVASQTQILTVTNPHVKEWALGTVKEVTWKSSRDGRTIAGVLILPAGYEPGKRYKALLQFHGGPEGIWESGWLSSWHDWAQMMASHGYAVLLPNPRGSDGQGPEFTEANFGDLGGGDYQDEMDGADWIVQQGIADANKMVAGGWSYGGYMTSWTIAHTGRFKAAVIGAGVTDLVSMATTTDIAPSFLDGYLEDFAHHRALYWERSPVAHLEQCTTPALIVHGEADERVPIGQGEEYYHGLRFQGKEARMIRFPREPHVFAERDHQEQLLTQVLEWYEQHLQ